MRAQTKNDIPLRRASMFITGNSYADVTGISTWTFDLLVNWPTRYMGVKAPIETINNRLGPNLPIILVKKSP